MRRYLETLFRRKDIFFIPVIVTPLVALGLLAMNGGQQEVSATLWVEQSSPADTGARAASTQNQLEAQALNEWLRTEAFRRQVLEVSGLAQRVEEGSWPRLNAIQQTSRGLGLDRVPLLSGLLRAVGLAGPSTREQAMAMAHQAVRQSIAVTAEGNNLLVISRTSSEPVLSTGLINAVINVYQEWTVARRVEAAQGQVDFQQAQVDQQRARVQEASTRLNNFLIANPAPRRPEAEAEADGLRRAYEMEQAVYEEAVRQLSEMRMEAAALGTRSAIQVIDAPSVPTGGGTETRLIAMMLFLGLVIGAGLGMTGIALITWTDRTVRGPEDLDGVLSSPLAGHVPALPAGQRERPHIARLIAEGHRG